MKILLSIVTLFVAWLVVATVVNYSQDFVTLNFDDTEICVPKDYVPDLSPFGKWLDKNVSGLDNSGQSEIIRLPARLIMEGVPEYKFSHINKYNVDLEHTVGGVAHNLSNVGNPYPENICEDEYDLGYCHQSIVYKDVFYQYTLKTVESKNKEKVSSYLNMLFKQWEKNCEKYG